jgi:hypothetical protein
MKRTGFSPDVLPTAQTIETIKPSTIAAQESSIVCHAPTSSLSIDAKTGAKLKLYNAEPPGTPIMPTFPPDGNKFRSI